MSRTPKSWGTPNQWMYSPTPNRASNKMSFGQLTSVANTKTGDAEVQDILAQLRSHLPDLMISIHDLREPNTNFVVIFFKAFISEVTSRLNVTLADDNQSVPEEITILNKVYYLLDPLDAKSYFTLVDLYSPNFQRMKIIIKFCITKLKVSNAASDTLEEAFVYIEDKKRHKDYLLNEINQMQQDLNAINNRILKAEIEKNETGELVASLEGTVANLKNCNDDFENDLKKLVLEAENLSNIYSSKELSIEKCKKEEEELLELVTKPEYVGLLEEKIIQLNEELIHLQNANWKDLLPEKQKDVELVAGTLQAVEDTKFSSNFSILKNIKEQEALLNEQLTGNKSIATEIGELQKKISELNSFSESGEMKVNSEINRLKIYNKQISQDVSEQEKILTILEGKKEELCANISNSERNHLLVKQESLKIENHHKQFMEAFNMNVQKIVTTRNEYIAGINAACLETTLAFKK